MKLKLNVRVALAILLVDFLSVVFFIYVIQQISSEHDAQQVELLNVEIEEEWEELEKMLVGGEPLHVPASVDSKVWLDARSDAPDLPAQLRSLQEGTYHDFRMNDRYYHLQRRSFLDKPAAIAFDITNIKHREQRLTALLVIGAMLTPVITLWLAFWLSQRLTKPVLRLAHQVALIDPSQRQVRLATDYRGAEVETIAQAFDRYQERLDQFVEREQAFSAAASHELRTPLATLAAASEVLAQEAELPERVRAIVQRMLRATRQMGHSLTGLMWLAREREALPAAVLDLKEELQRLAEEYLPIAEQKGVRLEHALQTQRQLNLPDGHVAIVVSNLLRNAIHFTPGGGLVRLEAHDDVITVQDTGRGIEPRHLHRIFDKDFRGADSPGAGLGLFISQRICLHHGWPLTVESTLGQGTLVRVRLLQGAAGEAAGTA